MSDINLDTSSPIITVNQATLIFKINKQNLAFPPDKFPNNSLIPISQNEILITNISSNYVAYRARITRKKYYSVEPSHLVIPPNSSIKVKITYYFSPKEKFPPEGHRFRFEGVVIPNNMKSKDTRDIFDELAKSKKEVKGNSLRKVVEFIFDNYYIFDPTSENVRLDSSTQSLGMSENNFNMGQSVYSSAFTKSNERPSRLALKNKRDKLRGRRMEETMNPAQLKVECERLQNEIDNKTKELNDTKQKINNLSSKTKFRYIVPDVNFSAVNNKMLAILFGTAFFLGFYLTK
jgi:hypothetical protein